VLPGDAVAVWEGEAMKMAHPSYPPSIPRVVPPGQVLVHNRIRPDRRQGARGFLYWLQAPEYQHVYQLVVERCPCGWAPELPEHYRVPGIPDPGEPESPSQTAVRPVDTSPAGVRHWPLTPEQRAFLEADRDWRWPLRLGLGAVLLTAVCFWGVGISKWAVITATVAFVSAVGGACWAWSHLFEVGEDLEAGTIACATGAVLLVKVDRIDDETYHIEARDVSQHHFKLSESVFAKLRQRLKAELVGQPADTLGPTTYHTWATLIYADHAGYLLEVQDGDGDVVYRSPTYARLLREHTRRT
jgi:hypothetical protein